MRKLYFDGSCMPKNPGGVAGFAWRLLDESEVEIASDSGEVCRGQEATNNIAEWAAVRNGLRFLQSLGYTGKVEIYGDSQLVIRQLLGEYRVKKETLIPYHKECLNILKTMEWEAIWIPREANEECDKRSRKS